MNEDLTRNLPGDVSGQILSLLRALDARLTGLEDRVERRLMETRPVWVDGLESRLGKVETRLGTVETRLGTVETRLEIVETRLESNESRFDAIDKAIDNLGLDMRAGFKRLERQMAVLAGDGTALRMDQQDLERRMDRLEDKLDSKPLG